MTAVRESWVLYLPAKPSPDPRLIAKRISGLTLIHFAITFKLSGARAPSGGETF
jgi:hypothetical protein